ncbi:MAG TPA: histidinol-phosphate transaminase [Burkholderiales bacterium]|nr:histidinol-phosphate transaminase [Burkholderiales bacterium]
MTSALDRAVEALDLCEQAPSYVRGIAAYQPGKPITELAREFNLDPASIVKLASNENPLGMSPKVRAAIEAALPELHRYPDNFELLQAVAKRVDRPMDSVVLGNGSNDLLEMVAAAFLAPGRSAVFSQHAFAVYPLATQSRGARSIVVPAKNWGHDLSAMRAAIAADTRVVFIANPNNPTGTLLSADELSAFLDIVPAHIAVVLDEAYNEYLPAASNYDSRNWLRTHPNLIVTRTFSKAYGLAGLRIGYAMCDARVADLLNRVRQPFNVNNLALVAAIAALDDQDFVRRSHALNSAGMLQLTEAFKTMGLAWIRSAGNFVAVEIPRRDGESQAALIYQKLLRAGIIVRPIGAYAMPDHLRVSIGRADENERFIQALKAALA